MDRMNAKTLTHHQIASHLIEELNGIVDNIGWWAQSITVAYEQYIGRSVPGQRPDGTFQMSVSKATTLGMTELMDKWSAFAAGDDDIRAMVADEVRVSGTENRITWRTKAHDGSQIRVTSEPKKDGTASIVAMQMGLATDELNSAAKTTWAAIIQRFLATL